MPTCIKSHCSVRPTLKKRFQRYHQQIRNEPLKSGLRFTMHQDGSFTLHTIRPSLTRLAALASIPQNGFWQEKLLSLFYSLLAPEQDGSILENQCIGPLPLTYTNLKTPRKVEIRFQRIHTRKRLISYIQVHPQCLTHFLTAAETMYLLPLLPLKILENQDVSPKGIICPLDRTPDKGQYIQIGNPFKDPRLQIVDFDHFDCRTSIFLPSWKAIEE